MWGDSCLYVWKEFYQGWAQARGHRRGCVWCGLCVCRTDTPLESTGSATASPPISSCLTPKDHIFLMEATTPIYPAKILLSNNLLWQRCHTELSFRRDLTFDWYVSHRFEWSHRNPIPFLCVNCLTWWLQSAELHYQEGERPETIATSIHSFVEVERKFPCIEQS